MLTGYNTVDQLRASDPDVIVEHLKELQEMLLGTGCDCLPRPGVTSAKPIRNRYCGGVDS